jgi:ABC-type lipopolysaccharide export system ATPase subunit
VMAAGKVIADGAPSAIKDNPLVRTVYLGEEDEADQAAHEGVAA